jgi:hypothetical protein
LPLTTDLNDGSSGVDGGGTRGNEQEGYQEEEKMGHLMTMQIGKGRQASGEGQNRGGDGGEERRKLASSWVVFRLSEFSDRN